MFLLWMLAARDSKANSDAKSAYSAIDYQNRYAQKQAQNAVQKQIESRINEFIRQNGNCDIIIDTGKSSFFKFPKSYKKYKNIYKSRILTDGIEISCSNNYDYKCATLETRDVKTGGNLTGFSVSPSSNGYSISPEYSSTSTETEYFVKDRGTYKNCAIDTVYVKAVKSGTAEKVIQKEQEMFLTSDRYALAIKYKKDNSALDKIKNIDKKSSRLYNIFSFLSELSLILILLLTPLCIANEAARTKLLPTLLYDLIFNKAVVKLYISLFFIAFFCLINISSFGVLKHIKKVFIQSGGIWNQDKRGALNYSDNKKEFLNLQFANEWQDGNRYSASKCRIIYASAIIILSYLSFFIDTFTSLTILQIILSIALDIIYVLWVISAVISNTLLKNFFNYVYLP